MGFSYCMDYPLHSDWNFILLLPQRYLIQIHCRDYTFLHSTNLKFLMDSDFLLEENDNISFS